MEQNPSNTPIEALIPVCPYCNSDPAGVAGNGFQMGRLSCIAIFCSNPACRKIYSIQVIGEAQPQQNVVVPERPKVIRLH